MSNPNVLGSFDESYRSFRDTILSLSDEEFLSTINDRTVRDIVAHLVGWNEMMIDASLSVMAGTPPAYYADAPNDYSTINAGFIAKYSSLAKLELLTKLELTKEKLTSFILNLPAGELLTDRGVKHYSGKPVTVADVISSLARDYQYHAREISEWVSK